jgi:phosphoribosylanthranilate isomerase
VKIKICGLFRQEDIGYANEAQPDYIGFVFAKSRRQVSPVLAAKLREKLDAGIIPVGVFVNAPVEEIAALYRDNIISIAQLHGDEDGPYIAALKALTAGAGAGGMPVIKALRAEAVAGAATGAAAPAATAPGADYLLLDHGAGGTGKAFDWGLVETLRGDSPQIPWFLSGGIGPHNIETAVLLQPFGIDVSSGAETGGLKDHDKILKLVQAVRNYNGKEKTQT